MSGHAPGKGRKRAVHEEEHVNHERWLISYSDMITVLMALFIVLFAISQVDQEKYIALRDSLSAGFLDTTTSPSVLDGTTGNLEGHSVHTEDTPADGTAGMVNAENGLGMQAADPVAPQTKTPDSTIDPAVLAAAQAEALHLEQVRDAIAASLQANGLDGVVRFRI